MPEIIFLKDEQGKDQAYEFLDNLLDRANGVSGPPIDPMFPALILKGLENLEQADEFPVGKYEPYETVLTLEYPRKMERNLTLVKALLVPPIYELRVDWDWNCKFRSIYFPFTLGDKKYYCFVKSFIKTQAPRYDPTDIYRDEAKRIYERVRRNPQQYLL
jgi:hypothetical protein